MFQDVSLCVHWRSTVIASQRVGAKRRPMINSSEAIHRATSKYGLLRRFAPRNDEEGLRFRRFCFNLRRLEIAA
jgi:hypothetical protein